MPFHRSLCMLAAAGAHFGVRIWDIAAGSVKRTISPPGFVRSVTFSPDGASIAIGSETTVLWDLAADAARGEIRDGMGEAPAFSTAEIVYGSISMRCVLLGA